MTPNPSTDSPLSARKFEYRVTDGTSLSDHIRVLWVRLDLGRGPEWVAVGRVVTGWA